jgi:class 3 adenylate cyclase
VAVCAQCGRESPDDFGFCPGCGAVLGAGATREVRKVVTVLFCDLAGSTALGERTDPEALRVLMGRYYDTARAALERHGGTVEKFIGDAVMAVFGIPVSSEDDALRAVRAAVELRGVVHGLGLEARIGVNTGEVVAGDGDTLVTGDAVNVAARLEQAAGTGEILLGGATVRLVRDAVEAQLVELTVKGKARPLAAYRLEALDATAAGVERHLDRPLIGRARERERMRADFADVAAARACRLFTLVGPAGVGKSRLVADFLEHVGETARVARGRALSYGEGITYWPLVEIILQLGLDADEAIRSSAADTQLATRALLEQVAQRQPLVIVLDDLQWAEPPLLDLVEHVADWSREAPIYLLCIARPELLDVRPGWGGGKLNATSILLEPLPAEEAALLADTLLDGLGVDDDTRARVLAAAEGNPLFIEEMSALAQEAGGVVEVPPTIQAVLQARLDRLSEPERVVIERGAVEGKVFHRGSVTALAPEPDRDGVPGHLLALVRKELVRPDRTQIPGDDAFRFRHLLIRDTAYEALSKATRAELHEQFAGWLGEHGDLLELDEIVGYHLEQAARYRRELDPNDARAADVGRAAAERLGRAGRAAFEREDYHATCSLLSRAVDLLPDGPERRGSIPFLVLACSETGNADVAPLLVELERGDDRDRALLVACQGLRMTDVVLDSLYEDVARLEGARAVLAGVDDAIGMALCDEALGWRFWGACRAGDAHAAYRRARATAVSAGSTALQRRLLGSIVITAVMSGTHLDEVRALIDELYEDAVEAGPLVAAMLRAARARMDFQRGLVDHDAVHATSEEEVALLEQTGLLVTAQFSRNFDLVVAPRLLGDAVATELGARMQLEEAERLEAHAFLANNLASWAWALCDLGDAERALEAVARGRELAQVDDVADQISLDCAEARALALLGDHDAARALVERARHTAEGIQMVMVTIELDETDAEVRALRGDTDGARALLAGLVERAEARGAPRGADRHRKRLAALDG